MKTKRYERHVRFGGKGIGFTYPLPMPDLEHKLRYHPEQLTKGELLSVASVLEAYWQMVTRDSQRKRNFVCKELSKIINAGDWY